MNVNYIQYDASGTIVGSGHCSESDLKLQQVPEGGGVLQTDIPIYPPMWLSYKVTNGVLTKVD